MALSDKAKQYLFWALTNKPLADEVSGAIDAGTGVNMTDLASTSSGKGASLIGIQDALGVITATTVEGALAEIAGSRFSVVNTLTFAEANAGKVLYADALVPTGKKIYLEGLQLSVGGATAWSATASSTKITFSDTSSVALVDVPLTALVGNAVLGYFDGTNLALLAAAFNGGSTAGKGITVRSNNTHDIVAGSTISLRAWGRLL